MSNTPAPTSHALPVDVRDLIDALVNSVPLVRHEPGMAFFDHPNGMVGMEKARAALDARLLALVQSEERLTEAHEMAAGILYRVKAGIGDVPRAWVIDHLSDIVTHLAVHSPETPQ